MALQRLLQITQLSIKNSQTVSSHEFNAVDAGMYFVRKDILSLMKGDIASLEDEVFPLLISTNQLSGFATQNMFYDVGTMERIRVFDKAFDSKKAYNQ